MKTIYKYELPALGDTTTIKGRFTNLLTLQLQNYKPYIWMEIDTEHPEIELSITAVGTGQPLDLLRDEWYYIDSIMDGPFMCHYYVLGGKFKDKGFLS